MTSAIADSRAERSAPTRIVRAWARAHARPSAVQVTHVYADEHAAALSAMALVTCTLQANQMHRVGDKRVFLAAAERHTLIMR